MYAYGKPAVSGMDKCPSAAIKIQSLMLVQALATPTALFLCVSIL
jgi:hypothetical protein